MNSYINYKSYFAYLILFKIMNDKWFVIVNPTSGNGAASKKWPLIEKKLKKEAFIFDYKKSEYHNHAEDLSKEAVELGYNKIIAVGGDGTFHQVINGISKSKQTKNKKIKLGIIPVGTGNDWVKTYKIPTDIKKAISIIQKDNTCIQDLGKITLLSSNKIIYFNNLAGVGFDAFVVKKIQHYKNLGVIAYLVAGIISIINFKRPLLTIQIGASRIIKKRKSLMLLIGLCSYCGGGMRLTKDVNTTDNLFDITYVERFGFFNIFTNLHNIFNGELCNHKLVKTYKSYYLKIDITNSQNTYIQADGELIGSESFTVVIEESNINFIIPE